MSGYHSLSELCHTLDNLVDRSVFGLNGLGNCDHVLRSMKDSLEVYEKMELGLNPLYNISNHSPQLNHDITVYLDKIDHIKKEIEELRKEIFDLYQNPTKELYDEFKHQLQQLRDDIKQVDSEENHILMDSWNQEVGTSG